MIAPATPPRLAIAGLGLIGGAVAAAWRRAGVVGETLGFDPDPAACRVAAERGLVDRIVPSSGALAAADVIVLATPVGASAVILGELAPRLSATSVVTDVGSVKVEVIEAARRALGPALGRFVPAHPIAGGERSGAAYATADLFERRLVVTTPLAQTDPAALRQVEALWCAAGARVERMDPAQHDRIYAAVSHLPHLLAFAMVATIADGTDRPSPLDFAGAGFRDMTRIAASSASLWRDVALANAAAIGAELEGLRACLASLQQALANRDAAALEDLFARAGAARRALELQ
jgi:prephenate dehydrogenase